MSNGFYDKYSIKFLPIPMYIIIIYYRINSRDIITLISDKYNTLCTFRRCQIFLENKIEVTVSICFHDELSDDSFLSDICSIC